MASLSLVLRTYNAMAYWPQLIQAIQGQTLPPDELLVVDSESRDETVREAERAGARVVTIPQSEFTHAASTNLGFYEARGEWVAMLSQDALPAARDWLANLVRPLQRENVAAVFGRQIPRPRCFPLEAWELLRTYPARGGSSIPYSNVNSAAKRSHWEAVPFDTRVAIAEDRFWALEQKQRGHDIVYEPSSAVIHSHEYTFKQAYDRCREEARALRDMEGVRHGMEALGKSWPKQSLIDGARLAREGKLHYWPKAVAYRLAQFAGMAAGSRA